MCRQISQDQIKSYLTARGMASRFIRHSSPPLSNKGLAALLKLETSAFNKFINGTIFVDDEDNPISVHSIDSHNRVFLRPKWTINRLSRFIQQVEVGCWEMGIEHPPSPTISESSARTEAEQIRLDKYVEVLMSLKKASIDVTSALALWNAFSLDAYDAREHLRPTMCVNALLKLGDIVDRKGDDKYCVEVYRGEQHVQRLWATAELADGLVARVHDSTGNPCLFEPETREYVCYHKAHGYGGYARYFLGLALQNELLQQDGVEQLMQAVVARHELEDGHVANMATVLEVAIDRGDQRARKWAKFLRRFVDQSSNSAAIASCCARLPEMCIPQLRELWGSDLFRTIGEKSVRP